MEALKGMKVPKKYNVQEVEKKYAKRERHISCSVTFTDGEKILLQNMGFSQVKFYYSKKPVEYIAAL